MFGRKCSIIGVVHVLPLPGSSNWKGSMEQVLAAALDDALTYKENGIDAVMIENMHDRPYLKGKVEPETTAAMTVIANAVKYETMLPTGIQILAGANKEALGTAVAVGLDFIRAEGFVYGHLGDEGWHESCAPELMRKRSNLLANHIKIFADIKKKHSSHAATADVSLKETAKAAEFFGADGVIVTGASTAEPASLNDVKAARSAINGHIIVGSGITVDNVNEFASYCDALIVGSSLKYDGVWHNNVDPERVSALMNKIKESAEKVARQ